MRRAWAIAAVILVTTIVAVLGGGAWVMRSERGLQAVLDRLDRLETVRIEVAGSAGVLAGPLAVDRLLVDTEAVRIEARGLRVERAVTRLLGGSVRLSRLEVARLEVLIKEREKKPPSVPHFLPRFLRIAAPGMEVRNVAVTLANGQRLTVARLRGDLRMTRWRIDVESLSAEDPAGRIDGKLSLRATQPLGVRGELAGHWRLPDDREYRFSAGARGNLDRLATELSLTAPARLSFSGSALTLSEGARLAGIVRMADFDGSPWIPPGRMPRLSGSLAISAGRETMGVDGTLTSPDLGDEPLRIQGAARRLGRALEIDSLRAWRPRSELAIAASGTVRFEGGAPQLALEGEWTALRWPLAGEPVIESPLGAFRVDGILPYAFEVKARARGPRVPQADFTASGSFDREQLTLEDVEAFMLRGRVRGSGRLSWVGDRAWRAQVTGTGVDVSVLRPDLSGRVSLNASMEGRGFTVDDPWLLQVSSLSGTLQGRALDGAGEVSHRDGIFELRRVRIANAASHVNVSGRWGKSIDLRWDADIRSLALVSKDFAGELVSTGTARGSQARPHVTAEARVRNLVYGTLEVDAAEAAVNLDLADEQESRVDVRADGLVAGGVQVDSVHVRAQGRTREHDFDVDVTVPPDERRHITGFTTTLAVAGGLDLKRLSWRGELDNAAVEFPDGRARLLQPVEFEVGRERIWSAPLCFETGDARLCVEGEWRTAPRSWRVIYSVQDWPLRRLLTSLLGRREFDGKLQASGWASQEPGQDWVGGTSLWLEDPTLDIRRNKFRTQRVELGRGQLDLFAEPAEIRVTAELDLAQDTRIKGQATVTRVPGQPVAEHLLRGELRAESAVLTALPVFVPEIDRSEGQVDAQVDLGGRLGAPEFEGEFHVRDGRFDFYRTNLVLSGVTLDGHFIGDELEFGGRAATNQGPVTLQGRFRWPEGVMTGSMQLKGDQLLVADTPEYRVVASPDVTVNAGADGFDVTGQVLIPAARIAPKDLSTSVSTSADERIVGLEDEEAEPSSLQRVRSTVRVALGDDVRVDSFGLKARLGGEVTVKTRPQDVARGDGAIRVIEGEYKAFGQFVRITRGILRYDDTPLTQPSLDLVAEREIKDEDVTVAVNVRGRLDNPFITITSEPAMSSNEALSYLLTGRSLNTLQSSEAASVDRAAESLALSGGGLLLGSLGTRIGLDEVSVERTSDEDTSVVLGKFLSPKLFVSYGISIAEAINTIKLRYTLNPKWSLKAEAGLDQSADIEYRIER